MFFSVKFLSFIEMNRNKYFLFKNIDIKNNLINNSSGNERGWGTISTGIFKNHLL